MFESEIGAHIASQVDAYVHRTGCHVTHSAHGKGGTALHIFDSASSDASGWPTVSFGGPVGKPSLLRGWRASWVASGGGDVLWCRLDQLTATTSGPKASQVIGRGILGGALAGDAGLLAGALTAEKTTATRVTGYRVVLTVFSSTDPPGLPLIKTEIPNVGSFTLEFAPNEATAAQETLDRLNAARADGLRRVPSDKMARILAYRMERRIWPCVYDTDPDAFARLSANQALVVQQTLETMAEGAGVDLSPLHRATKTCPFCAETILSAAIKCRYCSSLLDQAPEPE